VWKPNRRFALLNSINTKAEAIAFKFGLIAIGCLPRRQALRLGDLLLRKFPHLAEGSDV
jgi:hypothetical protein